MKRTTRKEKPQQFQQWMTMGELAEYLGKSRSTIKRWVRAGVVPEPDARTPNGWGLWSPTQVAEILRKITKVA